MTSGPHHIAVIMDGNGRWAKKRNLPRTAGHQQGAEAVKRLLEGCRDEGVKYLTLYAFSSENWKRSTSEVSDLMGLLRFYLGRELESLHKNNICVRVIGDRARLDDDIREKINASETLTQHNSALTLTIALSYGSRQEVVYAAKLLAHAIQEGKIQHEEVTEEAFEKYLYTAGVPDPDLLIRTGGEQRLSNFLLWQLAYTELYFTDILWPDFNQQVLHDAVVAFKQRERRFGTA